MVGPSYKENNRLFSGEGEIEEKKMTKKQTESMGKPSWPLSDLS